MASRRQQVGADLSRLESKATNLKANLKIYSEQLDKQLKLAKAEFGLTDRQDIEKEIKRLASELTSLQEQRDAANRTALKLLEKME